MGSFSHGAARTVQDDVDDSEEEDDEELPSRDSSASRRCSSCRSRNGLCRGGINGEGQRAAELGELTQNLTRLLTRAFAPEPF